MGICEDCGAETNNPPRPEPYEEDIHGTVRIVVQCDKCYKESCDDI